MGVGLDQHARGGGGVAAEPVADPLHGVRSSVHSSGESYGDGPPMKISTPGAGGLPRRLG